MRGMGGREKWRGGKGRAPELLLNHGPSEPCYATASIADSGRRSLAVYRATRTRAVD